MAEAYFDVSVEILIQLLGLPEETRIMDASLYSRIEALRIHVVHEDIPKERHEKQIVPVFKTDAVHCPDCGRYVAQSDAKLLDWTSGSQLQQE